VKSQAEYSRARDLRLASTDPAKLMHGNKKRHARALGIEFDIDKSDIVIPERCPVLDIPLKMHVGSGRAGPRPDSPSLDRIDPARGYVKGNVQVISGLANAMKNNATPEQLLKFADWISATYASSRKLDEP
jgi:hypothetical protein